FRSVGIFFRRRENLHHVALLKLGGERREASVDCRGYTVVPRLPAELVRDVDRRGAGRQENRASTGEDLDLPLGEIAAEGLEKLDRVRRLLLPVQHPAQPGELVCPRGLRVAQLR